MQSKCSCDKRHRLGAGLLGDFCSPDPRQQGRHICVSLGGHWTGDRGLCRCPAHDDRRPSLSVQVGRSRLLFHCFAGCQAAEILSALRARYLLVSQTPHDTQPIVIGTERPRVAARAMAIWRNARSIAGTPAERYLAGRGLSLSSPELRYHPRTPHGPYPLTKYWPALIAAVRDDQGVVGVHRTFVDVRHGMLAALAAPKLGLGPFGGGAVRLGGVARRIGLAEGIETALSAMALFGIPCWAALGTERFRLVQLSAETEELVLFLDNDAGGWRAEGLARGAFGHLRSVEARYPRGHGLDWNDVLLQEFAGPAQRPTLNQPQHGTRASLQIG